MQAVRRARKAWCLVSMFLSLHSLQASVGWQRRPGGREGVEVGWFSLRFVDKPFCAFKIHVIPALGFRLESCTTPPANMGVTGSFTFWCRGSRRYHFSFSIISVSLVSKPGTYLSTSFVNGRCVPQATKPSTKPMLAHRMQWAMPGLEMYGSMSPG